MNNYFMKKERRWRGKENFSRYGNESFLLIKNYLCKTSATFSPIVSRKLSNMLFFPFEEKNFPTNCCVWRHSFPPWHNHIFMFIYYFYSVKKKKKKKERNTPSIRKLKTVKFNSRRHHFVIFDDLFHYDHHLRRRLRLVDRYVHCLNRLSLENYSKQMMMMFDNKIIH